MAIPFTGTTEEDVASRESAEHGRAAHLFICLDAERPLEPGSRHSLHGLDAVLVGRGEKRSALRGNEGGERVLRITLPDRWMSSSHARLSAVLGRWVVEDRGSRNGTLVNGADVDRAELADGDLLEMGHTFLFFRELPAAPEAQPADQEGAELSGSPLGFATLTPVFAHQLRLFERIARSVLPVVVRGESGTGKELAAKALHKLSQRAGPFQPVNCGALPATLVESELFGYRKGAFTGANEDRAGLVRSAEGGTLFLDEIGDLAPAAQAALLRVLQESEVSPLGATRPIPVDVRIVAATHRDLEAMVAEGRFRADLLARLSGYTLLLPPLRERREDLGLLLPGLLQRYARERAGTLRLHPAAARALLLHPWPLNVRELEKAVAAALVLSGEGALRLDHFPDLEKSTPAQPKPDSKPQKLTERDQALRAQLIALLEEHGGNITAVAKAMGKARVQAQRWLKRFDIDAAQYRR